VSRLGQIADFLGGYPGFVPGVALSVVVAVFASRPVARALGSGRLLAGALIISLGMVLSATLTPSPSGLQRDIAGIGPLEHHQSTCDLSRMGPTDLGEYLRIDNTSLNVLLFVPLGLTVGLLPRSRHKTAIVQLAWGSALRDRGNSAGRSAARSGVSGRDVPDNVTGLDFGLKAGTLAGALVSGRFA